MNVWFCCLGALLCYDYSNTEEEKMLIHKPRKETPSMRSQYVKIEQVGQKAQNERDGISSFM